MTARSERAWAKASRANLAASVGFLLTVSATRRRDGLHNGWSIAGSFDGEFSRTTAGYAGKVSVKYTGNRSTKLAAPAIGLVAASI